MLPVAVARARHAAGDACDAAFHRVGFESDAWVCRSGPGAHVHTCTRQHFWEASEHAGLARAVTCFRYEVTACRMMTRVNQSAAYEESQVNLVFPRRFDCQGRAVA